MAIHTGLEEAWERRLFLIVVKKELFSLESNGEQRSVQNLCSDVKSYENYQPYVSM